MEDWIASLTLAEASEALYRWRNWARPNQLLPPGDWKVWLLMGGRRAGKTRAGAEAVREWVYEGARHIALVGKNPADVRDVMIENPLKSGLLDIFPPAQRPVYHPTRSAVTFHTGAVAHVYSGEVPDAIRGAGFDRAWVDELPHFQYAQETWDNLMFALSVGEAPRAIVSTTPLPIPLMVALVKDPRTVISRMSTYENTALHDSFRAEMIRTYEGTRKGRQELHGELLEDVEGALWRYEMFRYVPQAPPLEQVVVAIDPAATATDASDETGIIVAGRDAQDRGYILADLSGRYSPDGWAARALDAHELYQADRIVCETNNGGDMVLHTVRTAARARGIQVRVQKVTATRGKYTRAEPVAMLYEQGRMYHVGAPGTFKTLEDQMCQWSPGLHMASPDRIDSATWAFTVLMVLRRGLMVQGDSAEVAPVEDEQLAHSVQTFSDSIVRDGVWFPRG